MKIISCYFGARRTKVYPAPLNCECYFFSNNPKLKRVVERKGWTYQYLDNFPLSADLTLSSLQSKFVKFLQFDKKIIGACESECIFYFDHKLRVTEDHVDLIKRRCEGDLLICNSPMLKLTVYDEIEVAMGQKRYASAMDETKRWISLKLENAGYSSKNRVMSTGLLFYKDPNAFKLLCDEVYRTCLSLNQPECQIFWAVLSQKYDHQITRVEWSELDILWRAADRGPLKKILQYFKTSLIHLVRP